MNRIIKIFTMLCLMICASLASMEPTVYDQSIIREDWPKLHTLIAQKKFRKAKRWLKHNPHQINQRAIIFTEWREISVFWELADDARKKGMAEEYEFLWVDTMQGCYKNTYFTALELAILYDAPIDFVLLLLQNGANPNSKRLTLVGKKNIQRDLYYYVHVRTPLYVAMQKNNQDVIELLLSYNANPEQVLWTGESLERSDEWGWWWISFFQGWKSFNELSSAEKN